MADELDLLRAFRSDIPGPSADAWARARAVVGEASGDALGRAEAKPRTRRRWPLTISALGVASGTAAVVSVVLLGGSQTAFAGWSARPTTPTATQTAAAQEDCQSTLATLPGGAGSWSQVVTDVRGPYTVAVYHNVSGYATCFAGPAFTFASFSSASGQMAFTAGSNPPTPGSTVTGASSIGIASPGGGIEEMTISHLSQTGDGAYTLAEGRLEPTVSAVTLVLGDGQAVTATTTSGWFVAWWPSSQDVATAEITSASGTTTEPVDTHGPPTPPLPSPGTGTAVPISPGPDDAP